MPVGLGGAAFMRNLPQAGQYSVNEPVFNRETERNDVPLAPIAFTGLGGAAMGARIPNNGILTALNLLFKGTVVVAGGGTVTSGYQWPWNLLKRITLNANGQTSLLSAEGMDYRVRRQRIFRNPREDISQAPATDTQTNIAAPTAPGAAYSQAEATSAVAAINSLRTLLANGPMAPSGNPKPGVIPNGTYTVVLEYQLPIVHDDESLVGALFAQSDQNYLEVKMTPAQSSDLFTLAGGSTATVAGTIYPTMTFFDVPIVSDGKRDQVVIPNLAWLHGYLAADNPFANTGTVRTPFIRTDGQLLCFCLYVDNGGMAQIAITTLSELRFAYGGNRKPRVFNPTEQLLSKNARDYNGRIAPEYAIFDFEVDNPLRDLVYPKGVSELAIEAEIPAGTTINPNARVHFVEETIFAGM